MAFLFPLSAFYCDPNTHREIIGPNGLRMETSPEGGGLHLDTREMGQMLWSENHFLTAEVYHESHDVLVLLFTFRDAADRSITVHYGILPHVKTKLCFPLEALKGEKLFLNRYPGVMQSVIRGDASVDRHTIQHLGISTIPSTVSRRVTIADLCLATALPSFDYAFTPYVDELGQLAGKEWSGKMFSSKQLEQSLREELSDYQQHAAEESKLSSYGGWKQLRFEASGFFRTEFDGQRWWFVDPDGYALFSTGMDCIHPAEAMKVKGMEHLIPSLPNREGPYKDAWIGDDGFSYGIANLIRAFGEDWHRDWMQLTEYRMKAWGMNTIGNWSNIPFIQQSNIPYVYPLDGFPDTRETIFRDFPDVFSPEYDRNAKAFSKQLVCMRDDRRMVGYFMRNEPHWAFVDGLNLTERLLASPKPLASKIVFLDTLIQKYSMIKNLNEAWGSSFERFEDILVEGADAGSRDWWDKEARTEDFLAFNRIMIRRYVEVPAAYCRQADPNHLNLGMRYAWVGSDDVLEGCEAFDVFSVNCYQSKPDQMLIERISKRLHKPVMIGEFHFGASDVGMLAYGIRAVSTQEERGRAYQYFVEQGAVIPELIGVHYFQLNDQPVLGRFDGENYQIGVVDLCQQPYYPFVEKMKHTHERLYDVRVGMLEPFLECPQEIPKTGF